MQRYIVQRILSSIPVLILVSVFVFALVQLAPGDPASLLAGQEALPEDVDAMRKAMGLDKPIHVQLGIWFANILQGDLGKSVISKLPVMDLIIARLTPTLSITILSEFITVVVAVPLGVLAAWKANTWIDRGIMVFASFGFSIPIFFLAFLLIWAFALKIPLFPPAGYVKPEDDFFAFLHRLILPAISTGLILMALITRMTRASVLEILREDYIRTARSKGLAETTVLVRHALKNAALPIITVIGIGFAALLSGLVVTESVYAIPGVGRLIVDAIVKRDYPVIQGAILLVSFVYVFINLLIDLSYAFFDPRIRY